MISTLNEDTFSCILSHVSDSSTARTILVAIPPANPFFLATLKRLTQLPFHLSCDEQSEAATHKILDFLLDPDDSAVAVADEITNNLRHLIISVDTRDHHFKAYTDNAYALQGRLSALFRKTKNLRILDWCNVPGPSQEDLKALKCLENLQTLRIDCHTPQVDIFSTDPERYWNVDAEALVMALGPKLRSLEIRRILEKPFHSIGSHPIEFSSFTNLRHLFLDLMEGPWDWVGGGSPHNGASSDYTFRNMGFPALDEVEMSVSDLTLRTQRPGPMDLIHWEPLKVLSLKVDDSFSWITLQIIRIFDALPPQKFPEFTRLEIRDVWTGFDWNNAHHSDVGRAYIGLVPRFLASVQVGLLPNLTHLWVDHEVLCMHNRSTEDDLSWSGRKVRFYSVQQMWNRERDKSPEEKQRRLEWVGVLKAVFRRLESLRVGLGVIDDVDVGLILESCTPNLLREFGFHWRWQSYGLNDPISPALLKHLLRFPKLTDIHLLYPRPMAQDVYRSPDCTIDGQTISDIDHLFNSNPSLCRVGIGCNTVWERRCFHVTGRVHSDPRVLRAQDGFMDKRMLPLDGIPRFYAAGALDDVGSRIEYTERPSPGPEIEKLRGILEGFSPGICTPEHLV